MHVLILELLIKNINVEYLFTKVFGHLKKILLNSYEVFHNETPQTDVFKYD